MDVTRSIDERIDALDRPRTRLGLTRGAADGWKERVDRERRVMTAVQRGGKSIHGASVGILMIEARFPRIPVDVGNAATWPSPVLYRVVRDASPNRVVRRGATGLLDAFVKAGNELVGLGAMARDGANPCE